MLKKIGDYNVYETIGQGGFGIVKKIKHSITGKEFAVKILDKKILRQNELGESLKKEIVFMKMIDHPNVVKLHEVLSSRSKFFMVMELIPDGDLFSYLEKKDFLPEDESRNIFQQIICGLEFCHIRKITHRDLKIENILLDKRGVVKICDFGLSMISEVQQKDKLNIIMKAPNLNHTACGTISYMAPEVLKNQGYDGQLADIWSCGVILFYILTGRKPFDNEENDKQKVIHNISVSDFQFTPVEEKRISLEARDMIKQILNPNPRKRFSLQEIKEHPWFIQGFKTDVNGNVLENNLHFEFNQLSDQERLKMNFLQDQELMNAQINSKINFSKSFNYKNQQFSDQLPLVQNNSENVKEEIFPNVGNIHLSRRLANDQELKKMATQAYERRKNHNEIQIYNLDDQIIDIDSPNASPKNIDGLNNQGSQFLSPQLIQSATSPAIYLDTQNINNNMININSPKSSNADSQYNFDEDNNRKRSSLRIQLLENKLGNEDQIHNNNINAFEIINMLLGQHLVQTFDIKQKQNSMNIFQNKEKRLKFQNGFKIIENLQNQNLNLQGYEVQDYQLPNSKNNFIFIKSKIQIDQNDKSEDIISQQIFIYLKEKIQKFLFPTIIEDTQNQKMRVIYYKVKLNEQENYYRKVKSDEASPQLKRTLQIRKDADDPHNIFLDVVIQIKQIKKKNVSDRSLYCVSVCRIQQDIQIQRNESQNQLQRLINQEESNGFDKDSVDAFDQFLHFMHSQVFVEGNGIFDLFQ